MADLLKKNSFPRLIQFIDPYVRNCTYKNQRNSLLALEDDYDCVDFKIYYILS